MFATGRRLGCWLAAALLACGEASVAQDKPAGYPIRPIRLVISGAPGAGGDMMARAVAQMMTDAWGQNAIVDNRPGGSGVIAVELVARSAPDGYTLLSLGDNLMLLGVLKRVPFDVLKAFDPVVPTSAQPYVLLANPNMPFKSIKELVAYSATRDRDVLGIVGGRAPRYISAWNGWRSYPARNCCSYLTRGPHPASSPPWEAKSIWWPRARWLRPPR